MYTNEDFENAFVYGDDELDALFAGVCPGCCCTPCGCDMPDNCPDPADEEACDDYGYGLYDDWQ